MKSKDLCKKCEKETVYEDSLCYGCWMQIAINNKILELKKESKKIPKSDIVITVDGINLTEQDILSYIKGTMALKVYIESYKKDFKKM
jgi:uncharacterized Zn ribbon protein